MQHTSGEEAVGATFALGNARAVINDGRAVPTEATIKGTRKGTKGSTKGLKRRPHHVTIAAGNEGGDKEAGNSDEDCVATAKRDFKQQTQPPKDHFEKLLEAICPHHSYPIKHKLKDCNMMKKFMTSGAFSKGSKMGGDPGGKCVAPIPGEAEVMTSFD
jgi:hypothetical protein